MIICKSIQDIQTYRNSTKGTVGFVPTMGALHAGHMQLIKESQKNCDSTIVSIFVNPNQFNNADDYIKYPKTLDMDLEALGAHKADAVFLPKAEDIYADKFSLKVIEDSDSQLMEGTHRPGHFTGVLTVMLKLLQLTCPDKCFMGQKDFQQYLLVKKMCESFFMKTRIEGVPTVREADGLAMSSRNLRLSPAAREKASLIYKLLSSAKNNREIYASLTDAGFEVDYVQEKWGRRFVAATIESVRLIDNV